MFLVFATYGLPEVYSALSHEWGQRPFTSCAFSSCFAFRQGRSSLSLGFAVDVTLITGICGLLSLLFIVVRH